MIPILTPGGPDTGTLQERVPMNDCKAGKLTSVWATDCGYTDGIARTAR